MKLNWQAVLDAVAAFYRAFLKGRKVTVGGTEVTLPSQKPGMPPLKGSPFDSKPHTIEPPDPWGGRR